MIADLRKLLPGPASLTAVLNNPGRSTRPLGTPSALSGVAGVQDGFLWDDGDSVFPGWAPQGITGTGDAAAKGTVDGRRALLVSWDAKSEKKVGHEDARVRAGTRVSFVTMRPGGGATGYRHVLLVAPRRRADGTPTFGRVKVHAGGIVWYGRWLYVADTEVGLRVFDTTRMLRVNSLDKGGVGRLPNGRYRAASYQYALPQVTRYRRSKKSNLVFSFVSLDRSGRRPHLLTGEYHNGKRGRLVRWPLSKRSPGLLTGKRGRVRAAAAYLARQTNVQGALNLGKRVLLDQSHGPSSHGCLHSPGVKRRAYKRRWAVGGEDLLYDHASKLVYSLSEHPGSRTVFGVPASKLRGKVKSSC